MDLLQRYDDWEHGDVGMAQEVDIVNAGEEGSTGEEGDA